MRRGHKTVEALSLVREKSFASAMIPPKVVVVDITAEDDSHDQRGRNPACYGAVHWLAFHSSYLLIEDKSTDSRDLCNAYFEDGRTEALCFVEGEPVDGAELGESFGTGENDIAQGGGAQDKELWEAKPFSLGGAPDA